jgi:uncharacterized protein with HEPN domain
MKPELKAWLFDILQSIEEIESYFMDQPKIFEEFQGDLKTRRAVERNLEIIGEAVHRIINVDPTIQISNSRKIVDARNRIIHGYDTLTVEVIWGIIINHLPILKEEVSLLLEEE